MNLKRTAGLLIAGAVLANAAFLWLGSVFNYPDVLKEPSTEVLQLFTENQLAVTVGFVTLALASGLLGLVAVAVGQLSDDRAMRWAVPAGVAAAVVQVVGLLRWPLLVPGFAADAASGDPVSAAQAVDSFETAHRILGNLIGETLGYLLTAAWTMLVVIALGKAFAGRWFVVLGATSSILILLGVLSPLDVPGVDLANFVGYILWSLWLLAFAGVLLRRDRRGARPLASPTARQ
jgi:hypothetical protein